jgi:hypothetical protein
MVTATTVGYGDMPITHEGGRWWASFHIFVTVAMLGEIVSHVESLKDRRRESKNKLEKLNNVLDSNLADRLIASIESMGGETPESVTRTQWIAGMVRTRIARSDASDTAAQLR